MSLSLLHLRDRIPPSLAAKFPVEISVNLFSRTAELAGIRKVYPFKSSNPGKGIRKGVGKGQQINSTVILHPFSSSSHSLILSSSHPLILTFKMLSRAARPAFKAGAVVSIRYFRHSPNIYHESLIIREEDYRHTLRYLVLTSISLGQLLPIPPTMPLSAKSKVVSSQFGTSRKSPRP